MGLLVLVYLLTLIGFVTLGLVEKGRVGWEELWPVWVWAACMLSAHLLLGWRAPGCDQLLLPLAGCLTGLGLVMIRRLAPNFLAKQVLWLALGVAAMLVLAIVPRDLRWLRRYRYTWLSLGLLLVALTLVFGVHPSGYRARLWLGFGGFYIQPSELLKVLLIAFLASYLSEKRELLSLAVYRLGPWRLPPLPYLAPLLVTWGFSLFLLAWQGDLGTALLFFCAFLAMLYVASSRSVYVWAGLILFVVGTLAVYQVFAHVRPRIDIWLDPWSEPSGRSYQIVQSLLAFAAGGVLGRGLGYGQAVDYVPAVHTDLIFAAIGEELGLVGALAVVALYVLLLHRGYRLALSMADDFEKLLVTGLTAALSLQAVVIMGGSLKLIPLTGVTLPFVSYGGSSLVMNLVVLGLLLRVSRRGRGERWFTTSTV